jgi:hypothetical protein
MSTIHSNLSPFQTAPDLQALSQALRGISAQAQPTVQNPIPDGPDEADTGSDAASADTADATLQVARQNQFSALRDPVEAAAANQSAVAAIFGASSSALGAQSNQDPEVVRQLTS